MGLESFETEGRSAYELKNNGYKAPTSSDVHVLDDIDPDLSMVPNRYDAHTVVLLETVGSHEVDGTEKLYSCEDCNKVSSSFGAMVKADRIKFDNADWYQDFMDEVLPKAKNLDEEDLLDDFSIDTGEKEDRTGSVERDTTPSSGLDSFKT